MGFVREGLLLILGVLLFLSFLSGSVFLTLTLSLDQSVVSEQVEPLTEIFVRTDANFDDILERKYTTMVDYCSEGNPSILVDPGIGYRFDVPCDAVLDGRESVVRVAMHDSFERNYGKDYACSFWDCLGSRQDVFVVASATAREYWLSKFYFSLFACALIILFSFFLFEKKHSVFPFIGSILLLSALPLLKPSLVISPFVVIISFFAFFGIFSGYLSELFLVLFSQSSVVFWWMIFLSILCFLFYVLVLIAPLIQKLLRKDNSPSEETKEQAPVQKAVPAPPTEEKAVKKKSSIQKVESSGKE